MEIVDVCSSVYLKEACIWVNTVSDPFNGPAVQKANYC